MKIKSITRRPATGKFYDISVAKNHNFLANGCLAHNCNTSAQNAVIVGTYRGIQPVDELDILQAAGRAGRFGKAPYGNVYLICDNIPEWKEKVAHPRDVTSTLLDTYALAFHL
jgi:replicative superfamily II helicase